MFKLITFTLPLILCQNTFAGPIAKALTVKGDVTILPPSAREAHQLKPGEKINEDSSILTQNKSIAIVVFDDKSKMTIGPQSKVVVQKKAEQQQQIVGLLKGKIRAEVEKREKKDIKFIIKSKTASLGVRGTSFQTTFNPENNVTSLVTFNGEVAMVKRQKSSPSQPKNSNEVAKEIIQELKSKDAVLVKKGRYAGVSENLKKATEPVKIDPEQYARLKVNETFSVEKKVDEKKVKEEIKKIETEFAKDQTTEKKEAGNFNQKTGSYRPKSGGLVDLDTGIYVPPAADSQYDQKTKIFKVTETIGDVEKSGDYIAPQGVTLDPKEGFVAKDSSSTKIEVAKNLNKAIAGQVVKPKIIPKSELNNLEDEDDIYDKYFHVD